MNETFTFDRGKEANTNNNRQSFLGDTFSSHSQVPLHNLKNDRAIFGLNYLANGRN